MVTSSMNGYKSPATLGTVANSGIYLREQEPDAATLGSERNQSVAWSPGTGSEDRDRSRSGSGRAAGSSVAGEVTGSPPALSGYVQHYQGERRQTWTTPSSLFDELDREFQFTLDGAADPNNALMARYSSPDIKRPWAGERVFCNPPWSNIPPFVELAATALLAVLLVPARTNCGWFHRALELGAKPRFFKGKPRFGDAKWNSPVDCLLLVFNMPKVMRELPRAEVSVQ